MSLIIQLITNAASMDVAMNDQLEREKRYGILQLSDDELYVRRTTMTESYVKLNNLLSRLNIKTHTFYIHGKHVSSITYAYGKECVKRLLGF